jgi:hypothetical protein
MELLQIISSIVLLCETRPLKIKLIWQYLHFFNEGEKHGKQERRKENQF